MYLRIYNLKNINKETRESTRHLSFIKITKIKALYMNKYPSIVCAGYY